MANITFLRCKTQKKIFRVRSLTSLLKFSKRTFSNVEVEEDLDLELEQSSMTEADEASHVQQLPDFSWLPPKYLQQYHHIVVEPPFKDLQRRRKMYMTYGSKSDEDSRLLWPSRQEVKKMQEKESEGGALLTEKLWCMRLEEDDALKDKSERHKMIERNMAQMNRWISEYQKRMEATEAEILKKKAKKEALLHEARDYFGYRVKANDPKFQQMVEEKEERERKEAKDLKKKAKARKLAERLKQDVLAMKLGSKEEGKLDEKLSK